MGAVIQGRAVVSGSAKGELLVTQEPLSLWGGYDQASGQIIDRRHPLSGEIAAGKVLCLPSSRGSSTTTAVLLEAVRAGSAPAALITRGTDAFFALAAVVAQELYGYELPVVALSEDEFAQLPSSGFASVQPDGSVDIEEHA